MKAKFITINFIFSSFALVSYLLDCISIINTDVDDDDCHYDYNLLMMVILLQLLLSLMSSVLC